MSRRTAMLVATLAALLTLAALALWGRPSPPGDPGPSQASTLRDTAPRSAKLDTEPARERTERPAALPTPLSASRPADRHAVLVTGRVVDETSGTAIAGAEVTVHSGGGADSLLAVPRAAETVDTDAEGRFAIASARGGSAFTLPFCHVRVRAPGYEIRRLIAAPQRPGATEIDLGPIGLEPLQASRVVVLDDHRRPLEGAALYVIDRPIPPSPTRSGPFVGRPKSKVPVHDPDAVTDHDGTATLLVERSARAEVLVLHPDCLPRLTTAAPAAEQRILMDRTAAVTVAVEASDPPSSLAEVDLWVGLDQFAVSLEYVRLAVPARIPDCPGLGSEGGVHFAASLRNDEGLWYGQARLKDVGEPRRVTIELRRNASSAHLTWRVPAGIDPRQAAMIVRGHRASPSIPGAIRLTGGLHRGDVRPGEIHITPAWPGGAFRLYSPALGFGFSEPFAAGGSTLSVQWRLPAGVREQTRIRVRDADGRAISGASVSFRLPLSPPDWLPTDPRKPDSTEEIDLERWTDDDGVAGFGWLPAVDIDCVVSHPDHAPLRTTLPNGSTTEHEALLSRGGSLQVVALGPVSDEILRHGRVEIVSPRDPLRAVGPLVGREAVFEHLQAGSYDVRWTVPTDKASDALGIEDLRPIITGRAPIVVGATVATVEEGDRRATCSLRFDERVLVPQLELRIDEKLASEAAWVTLTPFLSRTGKSVGQPRQAAVAIRSRRVVRAIGLAPTSICIELLDERCRTLAWTVVDGSVIGQVVELRDETFDRASWDASLRQGLTGSLTAVAASGATLPWLTLDLDAELPPPLGRYELEDGRRIDLTPSGIEWLPAEQLPGHR